VPAMPSIVLPPMINVYEAMLRRMQVEMSRIIDRAIERDASALFLYGIHGILDHYFAELEAGAARGNYEADYPEAYSAVDGMTIEEFSEWRERNAKLS